MVLTGGGAQLKHLKQLAEYITGMDTRIGYPNEHLAGNNDTETTSPVYATAVGLVMNSLEHGEKKFQEEVVLKSKEERDREEAELQEDFEQNPPEGDDLKQDSEASRRQPKKSIFDKWAEKFKDFLDNAE
jgi:cell division protein FtsA